MEKTAMLRRRIRVFLVALALVALGAACVSLWAYRSFRMRYDWLEVDGQARAFLLHEPKDLQPSEQVPLIVALHGFRDTPESMRDLTRFNDLADEERFFVVYPRGRLWHWQIKPLDGEGLEDVRFVEELIGHLARSYPIDSGRVYVTGLSAGGMMTHLVGCALGGRVAAVAPILGTITPEAAAYADFLGEPTPVPVMMLHATADATVKWEGDTTKWYGQPGYLSVPDTVAFWAERNSADASPTTVSLPDADPSDGMAVTLTRREATTAGAELLLYTVEGGGHTWPGSLPSSYGDDVAVCGDIDATRAVWEFFKRHALPERRVGEWWRAEVSDGKRIAHRHAFTHLVSGVLTQMRA